MVVKGGVKVELGKIMGWGRKFDLSVGGRMENTHRDGGGSINLRSTVADAGLAYEIVKKFDLLFGYKMLVANGNEYTVQRDAFNTLIISNGSTSINTNEGIASAGLQLRFSPQQSFSVTYNYVTYTNNLITAGSYNISQLLLSYTGKF